MAHEMAWQMQNTPAAVGKALTMQPKSEWQKALPNIAAAAFSDAFAGMCAVEVLRNSKGRKMVERFLRTMRAELESREQSWRAQNARPGVA